MDRHGETQRTEFNLSEAPHGLKLGAPTAQPLMGSITEEVELDLSRNDEADWMRPCRASLVIDIQKEHSFG